MPSDDNIARSTVLGHSLHPVLTDLPLGCWTSATIVDLVGGKAGRAAATRLIGVGLLAAGPTAYAGLASWSRLEGADRRVGAVHAIGNDVAIVLFAGRSWPGCEASTGAAYGWRCWATSRPPPPATSAVISR